MGNGCSAEQANGGHIERSSRNIDSPVFVGMQTGAVMGNNEPRYCPQPPLPPDCGRQTDNCQPRGKAVPIAPKIERVKCKVQEWNLHCEWRPVLIEKTCEVSVPQYEAVCDPGNKQFNVRRYTDYAVDPAADLNKDGRIDAGELEAGIRSGLARPQNRGTPMMLGPDGNPIAMSPNAAVQPNMNMGYGQ